jgi:glycosyltransferase involved in cell wall biosynthesis
MLIVGAFPAPGTASAAGVYGGVLRSCELLLRSSLPERVQLILVDTTQAAVPPPGLLSRALRGCIRAPTFLSRLERSRPRTVLIFSSSGASFFEKSLYACYARVRGCRVLFFVRDGHFMLLARRSLLFRKVGRVLIGVNNIVLCQSASWHRFFVDELGVAAARCAVVENWTVGDEELALGDRRDYRTGGRVRVLFLGWIEEAKGIFDLLEAIRRVAEKHPEIDLFVGGSGSEFSKCLEWTEVHGMSAKVHFVGWVDGEEKARLLAEADIFVLPSRYEGVSNAVLEAMAAGLPVIASRVGGLPDVIADGQEGILVEAGDVSKLSEAIVRLVTDGELRETMGRNGRRAAERFRVESAVEKLLALVDG